MNTLLFTTTDAESLYYRLEKKIFSPEASFRQLILVPHPLVKEAVFSKLLAGSVATGFKILELGPGIDYLLRTLRFEEKKGHSFPAPMIFALHLQALLKDFLENNHPLFSPVQKYLDSFSENHSQQARIQELAETLSLDFLHYGVYGGVGLKTWLEKPSWQTELFRQAFASWDYPYRALSSVCVAKKTPLDLDIHVFGFSFIPKIYGDFFQKISSVFNIHHYYLTPTKEYFGSARTSKEKAWLAKTSEEFLSLDHPLLANFGKQTRRRFLELCDQELYIEEFFYQDPAPTTLLKKIQQQIFFNDPIEKPQELEQLDDSLFIARCFSYKREVEVLLKTLLQLMAKYPIEPADIVVFAPDISKYFPYIKEIFSHQSPLSISIKGLEMQSHSPFLQAFSSLIKTLESRFEKQDLMQLLSYRLIQERFGISSEELKQIDKWLDNTHFFWGYNVEHQQEILKRIDPKASLELTPEGTLSYACEKLLMGFCVERHAPMSSDHEPFYPGASIALDELELLSKWILFSQSLWRMRQEIVKRRCPLEQWIHVIKDCLEQFFCKASCQEEEGYCYFLQQLSTLEQLSFKIPTALFSFFHIKRVFHKTLTKKSAQVVSNNKNCIRFASLASQQMIPAKVVAFLGLDESSFPKRQATYPLREIAYTQMDPYPLMIEEQRQQLLDGLLYAQSHLIFSFCYFDERDGKKQECSYLLQEMLEIVDKSFLYKQKPLTCELIQTHGAVAFAENELEKKPGDVYFSLRDYQLACALYSPKQKPNVLFPEFYTPCQNSSDFLQERKGPVLLSHLQQFARNPLRYYMKDTLGVKIESSEEDLIGRKEFFLSTLDKFVFLKETLKHGFSISFADFKHSGKLPQGYLGRVSYENFLEEKQELLASCQELLLDPEEFFTIELSSLVSSPKEVRPKHWMVPALEVVTKGNIRRQIEGELDLVHPRGLVIHSKASFEDLLKSWPAFLVYLCVMQRDFAHLASSKIFFLKAQKEKVFAEQNPLELLSLYIDYFEKGLNMPSPLLPSWGQSLLIETGQDKNRWVKKAFYESEKNSFADDYQLWCFKHLDCFCVDSMEASWKTTLDATFKDFLKWTSQEKYHA